MKYTDASLPIPVRVEDLLARMTLEEKIAQMQQVPANLVTEEELFAWAERGCGSFLHVLGEKADELRAVQAKTRLKIPPIFGIDAIHGHALLRGATVFPSQLAMACSWNNELIKAVGKATAKEVRADGLDWTFSPVLCIARDTRWGRVNETFGEDPYLIGELGKAIIEGYQEDKHMIACAKHYIAYGEATGARDAYDSEVTVRKIREVFLPPFKKAIEANCSSVMTAYGSADATPITAHKRLLTDILKTECGFNGFVVTDWQNVQNLIQLQKITDNMEDAAKIAIEAGNDMSMATLEFYDAALKSARNGDIDPARIDDAVRRILTVKFTLGLFDEVKKVDKKEINCAAHKRINKAIADESIVMLKNNGILPLNTAEKRKIAVIGYNADSIRNQYGDWTFYSHPDASDPTEIPANEHYTLLRGIQTEFKECNVQYHYGCSIEDSNDSDIAGAVALAEESDIIIYTVGDSYKQNGEGHDRADLQLTGRQNELFLRLCETGKPIICVAMCAKPLVFNTVAEKSHAFLVSFNGGDYGGLSIAQILAGKLNPSGKLPISFPRHSGQLPVHYNHYEIWHGGRYVDYDATALYTFGDGLSYSDFIYSDLSLSASTAAKEDAITVQVTLQNNAKTDGYETVQLYVNDRFSSIITPSMELKGFKKVFVRAGETVTVQIPLCIADLAVVQPDENYVVEPGEFEIMVGGNTKNTLKTVLTVQ